VKDVLEAPPILHSYLVLVAGLDRGAPTSLNARAVLARYTALGDKETSGLAYYVLDLAEQHNILLLNRSESIYQTSNTGIVGLPSSI
jgi:glutathione synthase/RimK-type ligase-like ATP-grasp enzyme